MGVICIEGRGGAYVYGWFSGSIFLNFQMWEGGVTITGCKASKAGSDRRYTDIHIAAERIDRLVIFDLRMIKDF